MVAVKVNILKKKIIQYDVFEINQVRTKYSYHFKISAKSGLLILITKI